MNEHHYALISIENGTWQIVEHKPVPIATFTDECLAKACLELLNAQEPPALPEPQQQTPIAPDAPPPPAPAPPPPKSPPWTAAEDAVLRMHEFDTPRDCRAIQQKLPNPSIRSAKGVSGRYARLADKAKREAYAAERAAQPEDAAQKIWDAQVDRHTNEAGEVDIDAFNAESRANAAARGLAPADEPERKREYHPTRFSAAIDRPMARVRPPGPPAKTGPESGIEFNNFSANQPGADK